MRGVYTALVRIQGPGCRQCARPKQIQLSTVLNAYALWSEADLCVRGMAVLDRRVLGVFVPHLTRRLLLAFLDLDRLAEFSGLSLRPQ